MAEDRRTPTQKIRDESLAMSLLELAAELDEAAVKRWVDERWPRGFGSHEIPERRKS